MKGMIHILYYGVTLAALMSASGCATTATSKPLTYVAVKRPAGPIKSGGRPVENKHSRSGLYFLNFGFRPAPDVGAYLEKAQADAGSDIMRNTDVQLNIPFYFDFYLFGFQIGDDTVKANK